MAASQGEAALSSMLHAAQQTFEALRISDEVTRADRVQRLHAEYEQNWARVRAAAAATDQRGARDRGAAARAGGAEVDALLQERRELRSALVARNGELKEQIDRLRDLLCAVSSANS